MTTLAAADLVPLIDPTPASRVSLFLPTHRAGPEVQQNPIRLKNLLRQAKQMLLERGRRRPDAEALLEPAQGLLFQEGF